MTRSPIAHLRLALAGVISIVANTEAARMARIGGLMLVEGIQGAASDYIPAADDAFDTWQVNFNARVQANPGRYGLNAAAAADLLPLSTGFHSALIASSDPITRTPVTVAAKNAARASLKSYVRALVVIVQATLSVSNEAKAELGVTIRNTTPTPVPDPTTKPVLTAGSTNGRILTLEYKDELTPTSKSKPYGVLGCLVHVKYSATPVVDPEDGGECMWFTKSPAQFQAATGQAGKVAYISGRWQTRTGKIGPQSSVAQAMVAA